jgi:hypothetical protein
MIGTIIAAIVVFFLISVTAICCLVVIWGIFNLIKNEFTYRSHMIISEAIYEYNDHLINEGRYHQSKVTFVDMESYEATQKRFWDWGYTRILPPEKFELIKPFIKHRKRGRQ